MKEQYQSYIAHLFSLFLNVRKAHFIIYSFFFGIGALMRIVKMSVIIIVFLVLIELEKNNNSYHKFKE